MTGVTADFVLTVRSAPPHADPALLPAQQPALWGRFCAAADAICRTVPYGQYEQEALRTQFGLELPEVRRVYGTGCRKGCWCNRVA